MRQCNQEAAAMYQQVQKLTGPGAGSLKYDLIASLSVMGMAGPPVMQMSMMRLVALITARYNWKLDEFCVGQREMARMWSVNDRTVKREIKRLLETSILICVRQGVRGRVGAYRLNMPRIMEMSQDSWGLIGPDFEARMRERYRPAQTKVVSLSDYTGQGGSFSVSETPWHRTLDRLAQTDPAVSQAWFAQVSFRSYAEGTLTLKAPSRFAERYIETHLLPLLVSAAEQEFGPVRIVAFS